MRAQEDYNDHLDALAILSRAKLDVIGTAYDRVAALQRWTREDTRSPNGAGPRPDLDLGDVLHAYSVADGAWNRVLWESSR
jgi:hypothetical protein